MLTTGDGRSRLRPAPRIVVAVRRRRREVALVAGLPDVLDSVAAGFRAGAPPLVALAEAGGRPSLSRHRPRARRARRRVDAPDRAVRPMIPRPAAARLPAGTPESDEILAQTADLLAVAVAAGLTPYLALETAVALGPPAVA